MSDNPTYWLVIAVVAAVVAIWLAFQILGFILKLVIFVAAILLAVAAFRSWNEARRT